MHSRQPELASWGRERRLRILFARYIVLAVAVTAAIALAFYAQRSLELGDERADSLRLASDDLLTAQIDEETGIRGYALTGDRRFLDPYNRHRAQLERNVNTLMSTLPAGSEERASVSRFAQLHAAWQRDVALPVLRDPAMAGRNLRLQLEGRTQIDAMRTEMDRLDALSANAVARNTEQTHRVQYLEAIVIVTLISIVGVYAYFYERSNIGLQERTFAAFEQTTYSATRIGDWRMKVIAMLAHDFKSALAVISACADVLREFPEKRDDPGPYRGIRDSVEQLSGMTDEALLMARIASDVLPIKHERVELAPVLESVAERYRTLHPIQVKVGDEAVIGDEAYLLRAFDNLISNATKYSAPFQPIDFEARSVGSEIEIIVRDHGEGIDPEDIPHIFEEYWRSPHAKSAVGAGIGLFIVRKIIEAHGGSIDVISLPGIGTTLYVRLPASIEQPRAAAPPQSGV